MTKIISFFLGLLVSTSVMAACPKKINPAKVMLFVDVNLSDLEIASAQKAACLRGERLEVVPENYKEYSKYHVKKEAAHKVWNKCQMTLKQGDDIHAKCGLQQKAYLKADDDYVKFRDGQPHLGLQTKNKMDKLQAQKAKLTNFTISGHDGGGHFGGEKGNMDRQSMKNIIDQYPEMNEVKSLLLLGCYTGVQKEVAAWKSIFPKVKIIGGYDGSAPASTRPQGHKYIEDILIKEKSLTSLQNPKSINTQANQLITGLGQLNAAVYLETACKEEAKEYYYASHVNRKFQKFDLSACEKANVQIENISPAFHKYLSGELEPPKDTAQGELRSIYNTIRSFEHCIQQQGYNNYNYQMTSHTAFNLLFWNGIKQNFGEYFKDDLKEAEQILSTINVEELLKTMNESIAQTEASRDSIQAVLDEIQKDPKAYLEKTEREKEKAVKEFDDYKNLPEVKVMLERLNFQQLMNPAEAKQMEKYHQLQNHAFIKDYIIQSFKDGREQSFIEMQKNSLESIKQQLAVKNTLALRLKNNPDVMKGVFIPNSENLKNKTRKEILENIHQMHAVLSSTPLSLKQSGALRWMADVSSNHFQHMQNPFSWHEFTGRPETVYSPKLKDYTPENSQGYGMGGGYGWGGGGGYVGGYGGGYNGGWIGPQQQQQQQPYQPQQGEELIESRDDEEELRD